MASSTQETPKLFLWDHVSLHHIMAIDLLSRIEHIYNDPVSNLNTKLPLSWMDETSTHTISLPHN